MQCQRHPDIINLVNVDSLTTYLDGDDGKSKDYYLCCDFKICQAYTTVDKQYCSPQIILSGELIYGKEDN